MEELPGLDQTKVGNARLLFLDLSSTCTGYSLVEIDFEHKKAEFLNCGAIWLNKDWDNQQKYHYIFNAITNYFNIVGRIDYCVAEAYMINSKKMMGAAIGPELHGVLQVALAEIGVKYKNILSQTWRKQLGIKKNSEGDFKIPTKLKVEEYVTLPETIISNITGHERTLPNDVTDALAISLGFLTKINVTNFNFKNLKFQERIDF